MIQTIFDKINSFSARKISFILFAIGFVVYIPSLFNGFVWDDTPQIVQNLVIQNIGNIGKVFTSSTFSVGTGANLVGSYYKPLMPLSYMLLNAAFGLNPFFFHLLDVVFHALNGILLFLFFKKVLDYLKLPSAKIIAFFLAFLFLIHPVNVESVSYIASTQEVLYVFFMLLGMLLVFSLKEKMTIRKLILLGLTLLASILSKESGILAFPFVLILAFVLHIPKKRYIFSIVGIVLLVYFFMRFGLAHLSPIAGNPLIPIQIAPLNVRLQTIPYEITSYIRLLLFPKDLFIYQDDLVRSMQDPRFYLLVPIVIAVAAFLLILFIKVKNAFFRFFLIWIVFSCGIVLNIIPLDMTVAERWMYGPLVGILGCIGIAVAFYANKKPVILRRFVIVCLVLAPFYIVRDMTREVLWNNNELLYANDLQYSTTSARLLNDLGVSYADKGNTKLAERFFRESLKYAPYQYQAYDNLALLYDNVGATDAARLNFIAAIGHGALVSTYINYASFLGEHGKYDESIVFIRYALNFFPQSYELYTLLAMAYEQKGDKAAALIARQKAAMYIPDSQKSLQQQIPLR